MESAQESAQEAAQKSAQKAAQEAVQQSARVRRSRRKSQRRRRRMRRHGRRRRWVGAGAGACARVGAQGVRVKERARPPGAPHTCLRRSGGRR